MFKEHLQDKSKGSRSPSAANLLLRQASCYLSSVGKRLNEQIDKRLVRTFYDLFISILIFRHNKMGLLRSVLGSICGLSHAPAGTKRISNLLRSKKWTSQLIDKYLLGHPPASSTIMATR